MGSNSQALPDLYLAGVGPFWHFLSFQPRSQAFAWLWLQNQTRMQFMTYGLFTLHYANAPPLPLVFLLSGGPSFGAALLRFCVASLSFAFFFFAPLFAALHTAKVTGLLGTVLAWILRMQCKGDLASDIRGDRDWRLSGSPAAIALRPTYL